MNPAMKGSAAFFGVTVDLRSKTQQGYVSPSSDTLSARRRLKDDPSSRS
jgi:hypothetical protein